MVTRAAPASKNRAAHANEKVSLAANFLFADHSTAAKRSGAKRNKAKQEGLAHSGSTTWKKADSFDSKRSQLSGRALRRERSTFSFEHQI